MKISRYFTLLEAVHSDKAVAHGVRNIPDYETTVRIVHAAIRLDVVRTILGNPMLPSSWFRCPEVNSLVGSTNAGSQHVRGEAIDFTSPRYGTPADVCKLIVSRKDEIRFDQLILEHDWVHISFAIDPPREPRMEVLSLLSNGRMAMGLTDKHGKPL